MNQPLTFFCVGRANTPFGFPFLFDSPVASDRVAVYASGNHDMFAGSDLAGPSNLNQNFIIADHFSTANSFMFQNGVQQASGSVATNNLLSGLRIGAAYNLTQPWDGNICEMLFILYCNDCRKSPAC